MRKLLFLIFSICMLQFANVKAEGLKCTDSYTFSVTAATHPWTLVDGGKRVTRIRGAIVTFLSNASTELAVSYIITNTSTTEPSVTTSVVAGIIMPADFETVLVIDSSSWIWVNSTGTVPTVITGMECNTD